MTNHSHYHLRSDEPTYGVLPCIVCGLMFGLPILSASGVSSEVLAAKPKGPKGQNEHFSGSESPKRQRHSK